MKKELPEIFKKTVDKEHIHNKKISYTSENNIRNNNNDNIVNENNFLTVDEKIRKLFKSSRYVFNIGVIIKTDKKDYDTKVIGKVKNSLITADNDVIPIIEINDIIIKDHI